MVLKSYVKERGTQGRTSEIMVHFYGVTLSMEGITRTNKDPLLVKSQEKQSDLWAGILQLPQICHVTVGNLALLGVAEKSSSRLEIHAEQFSRAKAGTVDFFLYVYMKIHTLNAGRALKSES